MGRWRFGTSRGRILGRFTLFLALLVLVPSAYASTPATGFRDTLVATGLTEPTAIAFLPGGELLVAERGGALRLVANGTTTTLITIPVCTSPDGTTFTEMGLLGLAVDPDFESNGFIYLYRTKPSPTTGCSIAEGRYNQVMRVTMSDGAIDPASLTKLLTKIRTDTGNHNGGTLRIGPDGKLWVSVGDSGAGDGDPDPGENTNPYAQDLRALEGKVLRLELDGSPAAGNPFLGQAPRRPQIWAYGFRNPWRFGFDPVTGLPWLGDVGQLTIEELDIVVAGGNYAWPHCEGTLPDGCQHAGDVDPIFEYTHFGKGSIGNRPELGNLIVGGAFAPSGFGSFGGHYFFADPGSPEFGFPSKIFRAVPNAARDGLAGPPTEFVTGAGDIWPTIVDLVFGPDGLYYVMFAEGEIHRVEPAVSVSPSSAPRMEVALVPAYTRCDAPNRTHGPSFAHPSCSPPAQLSQYATVGTPDANGKAAGSAGTMSLLVMAGDPGTGADEADVRLEASVSDVRGASGLADYTGALLASVRLRITDRFNGATQTGEATTQDGDLSFGLPCSTTSSDAIGSTCAVSTTADALAPGTVREGKHATWALGQAQISDGGEDGDISSAADNTLFAKQGIFVP